MSRRPLELEDQHLLVAHATGAAEDGLDGGVEGLDHAEADEARALPHRITMVKTYRDFIATHVDPLRQIAVDRIQTAKRLETGLLDGSARLERATFERAAAQALTEYSPPRGRATSSHYSKVDIGPPEGPFRWHNVEVRPLEHDEVHIRATLSATVHMVGEYWFNDDPTDPDSVERDWDEFDDTLVITADGIADPALKKVFSFTIANIDTDERPEPDEHGE